MKQCRSRAHVTDNRCNNFHTQQNIATIHETDAVTVRFVSLLGRCFTKALGKMYLFQPHSKIATKHKAVARINRTG